MALQMKEETARIHQTLKSQAQNLDELEEETTNKVEQVAKVTEDVNEHVELGSCY
jgi:ABC-type transporter Mla subunit MlaD